MNHHVNFHYSPALSSKFLSRSFGSSNMIEKYSQFQWDLRTLLRLHVTPNCEKYAFVVLDRPVRDPETTLLYWKNGEWKMQYCANFQWWNFLLVHFMTTNTKFWFATPDSLWGNFVELQIRFSFSGWFHCEILVEWKSIKLSQNECIF